MKSVYSIFLLLLISNIVTAQQQPTAERKIGIGTGKTSSLIFPQAVSAVDRGSADVLVKKVRGHENILLVKAAKEQFSCTDLTVITADGTLYSFGVYYQADPRPLVIRPGGRPVPEEIASEPALTTRPVDRKYEMSFRLGGVYIDKNLLYFRLEVENGSNLPFILNTLRFSILDRRQGKRTASQELEITPLGLDGNTEKVDGMSKNIIVATFHEFTIPDKKLFRIELTEKNGGRNLQLTIRNRDILRAKMMK